MAGKLEGCYELSVGNADKGLLPLEEVRRRIQPFISENLPLVLTQVGMLAQLCTPPAHASHCKAPQPQSHSQSTDPGKVIRQWHQAAFSSGSGLVRQGCGFHVPVFLRHWHVAFMLWQRDCRQRMQQLRMVCCAH